MEEILDKNLSTKICLNNFQSRIEQKYRTKFVDYWDFQRWTVKNSSIVWAESWDYFGIICSTSYSKVMEYDERYIVPTWFTGARLNYAENLLRCTGNDTAIIVSGEERTEPEIVTFSTLRDEVSTLASAMRKAGVKRDDIIACFLSTRKEAVVSLLAAASIGAMFTATNELMGPKAVLHRFQQVRPKVLITIDRQRYNNVERNTLELLPEIVNGLPSLDSVIIVPSNEASMGRNISHIKNSIFYPDFMKTGLDSDGKTPIPCYEQLSFNHPFLISYTSGTTGPPKGMVHSLGAALIAPLQNSNFMTDIGKNDVVWAIFSPGWITFPVFITSLGHGASVVLYEGSPYHQENVTFWDMVDRFKVTVAMLSTPTLEEMLQHQLIPAPHNSLKTLRSISCGSSSVKARIMEFVHDKIKSDVTFGIIFGATEFFMIGGHDRNFPIRKEEIQIFSLGLDICCYSEEGERILDKYGELVVANFFPTMPLYIVNDLDNEKYRNTFFEKFPGVWCHGDICKINSKTRGITVIGRSDETIKQRGARFGSSEIYAIVNELEEVVDSICVSKLMKTGDEVAILFIKLKKEHNLTSKVEFSIRDAIRRNLTHRHDPEIIFSVKDIPYNMNNKRMEVLVKKIMAGSTNISADALLNPECLEEYFTKSKSLD